MINALNIEELIVVGLSDNRAFDRRRRHLMHSASNEQLLALRLEIYETIGVLELHSRGDNRTSEWYRDKLKAVLAMIDDLVVSHRVARNRWTQ